jgi:HAD superfamily hydrolase (TIGR01509 family)
MNKIKAVFFDMDGVIIDTEKDGHRVAFNETFRDFGFKVEWSEEKYHELLQVAGGKERMRHYLHTEGFGVEIKADEEDELIKELHRRKTALFVDLIESGKLPLRSGVKRIMQEVNEAGLFLAICTTSNERSAHTVAYQTLKDVRFDLVLAGDVVSKKKPDPEIYQLALETACVRPVEAFVIEDSRNGVLAAHATGIPVLATTNEYTEKEDLSLADLVVTSLGEPNGKKGILKKSNRFFEFDGVMHLDQLLAYFSG